MEVCRDVEEWIEESIEQEIEKQEQRCKKWPWPLSGGLFTSYVHHQDCRRHWRKIVRVVCEVIVVAWSISRSSNFVLRLPVIGPLFRAAIRLVTGAYSYVIGLADGVARLFGVRLTKHLRVHVIPLAKGMRDSLLDNTSVPSCCRRLPPCTSARIRVHTTYHEAIRNPPERSLRIGTEGDLIFDEAWIKGSWFQTQVNQLFANQVSLLFGVGQPVVVFVLEEVGYDGIGGVVGCSGGPFCPLTGLQSNKLVVSHVISGTNSAYPPT